MVKFRRQHPIGPFIADFYCPSVKLVIELDGGGHLNQEDYDAARTDWLNAQGIRVIRFNNKQVRRRIDAVLAAIRQVCQEDSGG